MAEEDEINIDFSKIKEKFTGKKKEDGAPEHHEVEMSEEKEVEIDVGSFFEKLKGNKKLLIYGVLIIILILSFWLRMIPLGRYTGIYSTSLSAMDPYAHYRRANELYENGHPGNAIKIVDGEEVYWDYLHDAPEGSRVGAEGYSHFVAYSYKYFARFFYPTLLEWHRITPALFGVLAVLCMYLLANQLFGEKAGLAAAFMFSLAQSFLTRSVAGFADTDAIVGFLTLLTFFLFVRAWDKQSYLYAGLCGISLAAFALTWNYEFVPTLMLGSVATYFGYKFLRNFLGSSPTSLGEFLKDHFKAEKKKYLVLVIALVVCAAILAFTRPGAINFLSGSFAATQRKLSPTVDEAGEVRTVALTVSEMNQPSFNSFLSQVHMSAVLIGISVLALLPFGLFKKLKKKELHIFLLLLWLFSTFYMAAFKAVRFIEMFVIPFSIFVGLSIGFLLSKVNFKKPYISATILIGLVFFVFFMPNAAGGALGPSYYSTAIQVSKSSGPSLSPNWINFFDWMREETPEMSIFASWWDPGHAIEAIGERPAVADGAQNAYHIHDLALIFTSTNETEAVNLLDEYNVSYFFTSSDLISKYGAISFLAGSSDGYPIAAISGEPLQTSDGTLLTYAFNEYSKVFVKITDAGVTATFRQGYQSYRIREVIIPTNNGSSATFTSTDNSTTDMSVFIVSGLSNAILLPPNLRDNMLTQLHLFDGKNLEQFEQVNNFGGEIKVYKVKY